MRLYIFIYIFLLSLNLFSQVYSYDKKYQEQLVDNAIEITDKQKEEVRSSLNKWANCYLDKKYKYNESVLLKHPLSKENKKFHFDCSGYISAVYWSSNIAVFQKQAVLDSGGVKTIYATLSKYKKIYKDALPKTGDIVMFDRTTSNTEKLTHAGIVLSVDEDETVTYAHASTSRGLVLGYMNRKYPTMYMKDGKIINSYLKRGGGVEALSSQLFNSYGTVLDVP